MAHRRNRTPLDVIINGRLVGHLDKDSGGAISFRYASSWLAWENAFPVSLSLALRPARYRGEAVIAVFDNLLPDADHVRRRIAERTGADGTDSYSLLAQIGHDCVGAMQFLPAGTVPADIDRLDGEPLTDDAIERMLAGLAHAPLGLNADEDFRISIAGAQEKTALLRVGDQWIRPAGTTPTTHIFKPQIGEVQTATGPIDLSNSVENEHYCLTLLAEFGLPVAATEMMCFGQRKVLVVERFDRLHRAGGSILRLPQEDFCQALSVPPGRKYQNVGGPTAVDVLRLLASSDEPTNDQRNLLKALIIFWLIGATDGHAKNFSIFLKPGGRFELTPFYDVISAQPALDLRQIPNNKFKLAMSAGKSRNYAILQLHGRHFVETARESAIGPTAIRAVLDQLWDSGATAADRALTKMPADFSLPIHDSIKRAIESRLHQLETALAEFQ